MYASWRPNMSEEMCWGIVSRLIRGREQEGLMVSLGMSFPRGVMSNQWCGVVGGYRAWQDLPPCSVAREPPALVSSPSIMVSRCDTLAARALATIDPLCRQFGRVECHGCLKAWFRYIIPLVPPTCHRLSDSSSCATMAQVMRNTHCHEVPSCVRATE